MKSNHLSFSLFFFSAALPLMHSSRLRSALLDLIKVQTPDLSPRQWCHPLATSSTSPPPPVSPSVYHFLSLFSTLHILSATHSSHAWQFSLSLSLTLPLLPPPALLHSSSLLSSAPYCSINLPGRRSISAPRLLFLPSHSAPLLLTLQLIFSEEMWPSISSLGR